LQAVAFPLGYGARQGTEESNPAVGRVWSPTRLPRAPPISRATTENRTQPSRVPSERPNHVDLGGVVDGPAGTRTPISWVQTKRVPVVTTSPIVGHCWNRPRPRGEAELLPRCEPKARVSGANVNQRPSACRADVLATRPSAQILQTGLEPANHRFERPAARPLRLLERDDPGGN
jgi:hypothetical protein